MQKNILNSVLSLFSDKVNAYLDKREKIKLAREKMIRYKLEWELAHINDLTLARLRELAKNFPEAKTALNARIEENLKRKAVQLGELNTVQKQEEMRMLNAEQARLNPTKQVKKKSMLMTMCDNASKNMFG